MRDDLLPFEEPEYNPALPEMPEAVDPDLFAGIDLPDGPVPDGMTAMGGMPMDPFADGVDMEAVFGEWAEPVWDADDPDEFDTNLAQFLDSGARMRLAQKVIEWVDADKASRADWEWREAEGIRKLGMNKAEVERVRSQVPGAEDWRSVVTHPGLMKACNQFWARAYTELFPPTGPAKTVVLGAHTEERNAQGKRVESFLNYLYLQDMPGATREAAAAIYRLPLSGSVFRKVFYNPLLGTLEVRFLESQDFVKPYLAVDLQSAQRYTHIVKLPRNDVNKLMALGYYLDEDLGSPEGGVSRSVLDRSIDEATGVSSNGMGASEQNPHEADEPDELYEMSVFLDLSDYGWDDPMGESVESRDGKRRISIGLPYRVTVHTGKQVTLEVRRDWREQDFRKRRRRNVAEYRFLPGFGGYGFGLLHIAGGLADSQTGLLRYLQDGCTLDTVGRLSGWVSQNMMGQRSLPPLKLGEFQSIPSTTDDWNKSVMRPDFQWRTDNTVATLEYLDGLLDELVSATNTMVGDGDKNVPVGTMLARIEQGSKPFAAIFSLLHESLKDELRAVAEMAADYLPERYPYAVEGADSEVFASDFDARVDVVPISDPNVVSPTQRQAQAQVVVEQNGALFDRNPSPETWGALLAAHEYLLEVIRVPGRERFVPPLPAPAPPGPEQADPAETEAAAEVARKDAAAIAEQQRKDWVAQQDAARKTQQQEADVAGKASAMATDTSAQRMGDQAIIARDQATDIDEMTRDILARAREQQMAQQANVAPEVIT